ncbi:response regulator transcription factor [Candidatus Babeliales bacterium]|nr:response regulator transcription factor [Candidatus Babeliales bacterium]
MNNYRGNPNNPQEDRPKTSNLKSRSESQQATTDEIINAIEDNVALDKFFRECRIQTRRREVGYLLIMGYSDKDMALKLELSPRTIHTHLVRLSKDCETNTIAELLEVLNGIAFGGES